MKKENKKEFTLIRFDKISVGDTFILYYKDMVEYKKSHYGICVKITDKDAMNLSGQLINIYRDSMVEVMHV